MTIMGKDVRENIISYFLLITMMFFSSYFSSCVIVDNTEESEEIYELEIEISDLEDEISAIEEDLYIAYTALGRIKQYNSDKDSVYCIADAALLDLGEMRFYRKDRFEIDILTSRYVNLDTAIFKRSRSIRHIVYKAKRKSFIMALGNDSVNTRN